MTVGTKYILRTETFWTCKNFPESIARLFPRYFCLWSSSHFRGSPFIAGVLSSTYRHFFQLLKLIIKIFLLMIDYFEGKDIILMVKGCLCARNVLPGLSPPCPLKSEIKAIIIEIKTYCYLEL